MIIATLVLLLFLGSGSLDLSDPEVLHDFTESVGEIVDDTRRSEQVVSAAVEMNQISRTARDQIGVEMAEARLNAIAYDTPRSQLSKELADIEAGIFQMHHAVIAGRERVRKNVSKREWKKLIKAADKN